MCVRASSIAVALTARNMDEDPFVFKQVLAITGGGLHKTVLLPYETLNGMHFIKIMKGCRELAKACAQTVGKDLFPGVDVIQYLQQQRNDAIDHLIREAIQAADPFAEVQQDFDARVGKDGKERASLYHMHKIPDVVDVKIPEFETENAKYPARHIKMLATPKTNVCVCIEATASNLQWFKDACGFSWSRAAKKRKHAEFDFPVEMDENICKLVKNDDEVVRMYCNYRKEDGKWTRFSRSLAKKEYATTDELNIAVSGLVKRLETFHEENHHPPDASDAQHDEQVGEHM